MNVGNKFFAWKGLIIESQIVGYFQRCLCQWLRNSSVIFRTFCLRNSMVKTVKWCCKWIDGYLGAGVSWGQFFIAPIAAVRSLCMPHTYTWFFCLLLWKCVCEEMYKMCLPLILCCSCWREVCILIPLLMSCCQLLSLRCSVCKMVSWSLNLHT